MNIDTRIGLIQYHIEVAMIMAAEAKFDENKINRAKDGKFASKSGGSSAEEESSAKNKVSSAIAQGKAKGKAAIDEAASIGSSAAEIGKISGQFIADLAKDKDFRKRAGLVAGKAAAGTAQFLAEKAGKFPKLEENLKKMTAEAENQLAEMYGKGGPEAQAMKNAKIPEPPKDASFKDKLEFQTARYKAYEEAIKDPEKYGIKESQKKDLMAKAQKAAVPVGIALACAAVPAAMGAASAFIIGAGVAETVGTFVVADIGLAAINEGKDRVVEKAGVEGPVGKAVIDVGLSLVTGGAFLFADAANIREAHKKAKASAQKSSKELKPQKASSDEKD